MAEEADAEKGGAETLGFSWLRDGGGIKILSYDLGAEGVWQVVPVLPASGGGAGLFAVPPQVDTMSCSPQVQLLRMPQ